VSALTQMLQLQMQMLVVTQATQVTQVASAPAQRVELGSPPRDPQGAPLDSLRQENVPR